VKTYDITVNREGRWWMVSIPEIDGLTQARRLSEVGQMARELIALEVDAALSEIEVNITEVDVAGLDVHATAEQVARLREEVRQLDDLIAGLTAVTAQKLVDEGVPMRDVAEVIGVSHQRVAQIVDPRSGPTYDVKMAQLSRLVLTMQEALEPVRQRQLAIAKSFEPFLRTQRTFVEAQQAAPSAQRLASKATAAQRLAKQATVAKAAAKRNKPAAAKGRAKGTTA
jgi:hypothetical protein